MLGYIWQCSPGWTLLNRLLALIRGMVPLVLLYIVKILVDEIQVVTQLPVDEKSFENIGWILGIAAVLFLLNAISASTGMLAREKQAHYISDFFDNLVHEKTTRVKYEYFEHPKYQNVLYRALNDASIRPARVFNGLLGITQNLIALVLVAAILLLVHWAIALLLVAITLPIVFIRVRHARSLFLLKRENTDLERKVGYYNRMLTAPEFAKELRLFNLGGLFRGRFASYKQSLRDSHYRLLVQKSKSETIVQVLAAVVFLSVYLVVAIKALHGNITIGAVVLYFLAMQRGYAYLHEMLGRLTALNEDLLFLDNLFEFLNLDEATEKVNDGNAPNFPNPLRQGVSFEGVGFHYPSNKRWILKNLSFDVKAGETVAIVGINGSGKSTLVKLLCSLYQPVEGQILIDGSPLESFNSLQKTMNISAVFQDFNLYNVTAGENIWFGNISTTPDEEMVVTAAKKAGIDKEISNFEKGYETVIGTLFENSEQMSPGQWQRLALARSFFNDPQILILDEPTSSLDIDAETKLLKYIRSVTRGRTSIIISHRLSTIRMADRVIFIEGMKVCESGTYNELMDKPNGKFRQMIKSFSEYQS